MLVAPTPPRQLSQEIARVSDPKESCRGVAKANVTAGLRWAPLTAPIK